MSAAPPSDGSPSSAALPSVAERDGRGGCNIVVNGESRTVAEGLRIADLLEQLGLGGKRVAVAIDRQVIPRSEHGDRRIHAGNRIEILEAVGGG